MNINDLQTFQKKRDLILVLTMDEGSLVWIGGPHGKE